MSPEVVQAIAQVMVGLLVAGSGVMVMETFRRRDRREIAWKTRAVIQDAATGMAEHSARRAVLGLGPRNARPKKTIADVPCGSCQRGYNAPHPCEVPRYCPCDHHDLHVDIESLPVDPRTPFADSLKTLWARGGAEVVGITPSPQFVPPEMNLDGPPVDPRPQDQFGDPYDDPYAPAPLEFDRPVFDIIGGKCKHEEHISELGSFNVWCLRCGVELEEKTAYDGRLIWRPVKGPKGCTHEAQDLEMVYLNDGLLVAWICTKCNIDGRFPWPEEAA